MCSLGRECICALVQVVRHLSGVIFCFHLLMRILGSSQQTSVLSTKMHNYSQQGGYFLASSRCCLLLVHLDILLLLAKGILVCACMYVHVWEHTLYVCVHVCLCMWGVVSKLVLLSHSYCSITLRRHHDQHNLKNKVFNWGCAHSSGMLVHSLHGRECSSMKAGKHGAGKVA